MLTVVHEVQFQLWTPTMYHPVMYLVFWWPGGVIGAAPIPGAVPLPEKYKPFSVLLCYSVNVIRIFIKTKLRQRQELLASVCIYLLLVMSIQ